MKLFILIILLTVYLAANDNDAVTPAEKLKSVIKEMKKEDFKSKQRLSNMRDCLKKIDKDIKELGLL